MTRESKPYERILEATIDRFRHADCDRLLERIVWPEGVKCPKCLGSDVVWMEDWKLYRCKDCRIQVWSVRSKSIFHKTMLPLWKCLVILWYDQSCEHPIPQRDLAKALNVRQLTITTMLKRIRNQWWIPTNSD